MKLQAKNRQLRKLRASLSNSRRIQVLAFILGFALVGAIAVLLTQAATPVAQFEAE